MSATGAKDAGKQLVQQHYMICTPRDDELLTRRHVSAVVHHVQAASITSIVLLAWACCATETSQGFVDAVVHAVNSV